MTLHVDACPECTSGDTYRRAADRFEDQPYRCRECGHEFQEPIRRQPRTGGLSEAGRAAEDAHPDILTDGGQETAGPKRLEFADEYIAPIHKGEKNATVRYRDADHLEVGDQLELVTTRGSTFSEAEVTRTATGNAIEALALLDAFTANYPTDDIDELLDGVNQHYDDPIGPATTVRVIVFQEVE